MSDSVGVFPVLLSSSGSLAGVLIINRIDRVFVHALNTVKRIPRTGTARPPTAERLKLYGLYKQSMGMSIGREVMDWRQTGRDRLTTAEGDVEGVMDRPVGNTTDVYAECEKWYITLKQ